ncbi:unnamed protein product [Adineta ricciae]|uniref:Carrier domain-containing protein n=1 Tax=Adineta ricciae TaxID=249248 RepID=A0A815NPG4_ADIRI|nr:unnamed protein product [Adineta ricciae]
MEIALSQKIKKQQMVPMLSPSVIPATGLAQSIASFAQQRIWFDEKSHHNSATSSIANNLLLPLVIKGGSMSIEYIRTAVDTVLERHTVLRTAIQFDEECGKVIQQVQPMVKSCSYSFQLTKMSLQSQDEIGDLLKNESLNRFAKLEQGLVVRCHVVKIRFDGDMENIYPDDLIVFVFHRVSFDYNSAASFITAFTQAYDQNECNVTNLQYIDFTLYEDQQLINGNLNSEIVIAQQFWHKMINDYSLDEKYPLPLTFMLRDEIHSEREYRTSFVLNSNLMKAQIKFAVSHNVSMFQLGLACYFLLIYELNDRTISDLCVTCPTENRPVVDTKSMIGAFVNILPYRIRINANDSFINLVKQICQLDTDILKHCQLPYQQIVSGNKNLCSRKIPYHFSYDSVCLLPLDEMILTTKTKDATLSLYTDHPWLHVNGASSTDFALKMIYDQSSRTTYCTFECRGDCYDDMTTASIGQHFHNLLLYIFGQRTENNGFDPTREKIGNFSPLQISIPNSLELSQYLPNVTETSPASYMQTRIWLDERRRHCDFNKPQAATYNIAFFYRPFHDNTLSTNQLCQALQLIINKHHALCTSFIFDTAKDLLMQHILDQKDNKGNTFSIVESMYDTDEQLTDILYNEQTNSKLFDLSLGLVFRCHIVYHKHTSRKGIVGERDVLILNFHHAVFDLSSMNIFLDDLNQAYTTNQLRTDDDSLLDSLKYTIIEQQMPMPTATMFWFSTLRGCNIDQLPPLPFDRYRVSSKSQTNHGISITFNFDQDLSRNFLSYGSSNHIKPEYIALTTYYAFLSKLTNGEKDLCIGMNADGRYRDELKSVIGMFDNVFLLRCQLDPHWFFPQLTKSVCEMATNCKRYSYFPFQRVLSQHSSTSELTFPNTFFAFQSTKNEINKNKISIGDCYMYTMRLPVKTREGEIPSKYDFILSIKHDMNIDQLSCTINASHDLFNVETIDKISQRFHAMLDQLFISGDIQMNKSLNELSLILPHDRLLMKSINNTEISPPSVTCIHHQFIYQAMKYSQKQAVELDEQSLTYSELLYYTQLLSMHILNHHLVIPGKIICQCVKASISMVIGMMAIEVTGSIYCPLSPQDPRDRLYSLIEQTQCRLVLVHSMTQNMFHDKYLKLNIDTTINIDKIANDDYLDRLSRVEVTSESIAYAVFTSGSTGIPKASQVRHRNFSCYIHSVVLVSSLSNMDIVIQLAGCSFDTHVDEILGALISGSTLIMLRPEGNMDFEYIATTLTKKQLTYIGSVPSFFDGLLSFLRSNDRTAILESFRLICIGGETLSVKMASLLKSSVSHNCQVLNFYGPTEATIGSTFCLVDNISNVMSIPIGQLLSNYTCFVVDEFFQPVTANQEGELFVGGEGVFAGYLGREDLTAKALFDFNGSRYYRTGDLVKIDNNGLLYFIGRKDFQIKLRGQRIELGEIERCLLNISISACIVIKWDDDHLIAYVQSCVVDEKQLRKHCQSHLPRHMVPSMFIILKQLPLNNNGKIDRKRLPPPNLSLLTSSSPSASSTPLNQLEQRVHDIWCEFLKCDGRCLPTNKSFFDIGGHSLLLIKLYNRYQTSFDFDNRTLSIGLFFQESTIIQHAKLLQTVTIKSIRTKQTYTLGVNQIEKYRPFPVTEIQQAYLIGREVINQSDHASCFQYEEYDMSSTIDIEQLEKAWNYLIQRHEALRIIFPSNTEQRILEKVPNYTIFILDLNDIQSIEEVLIERRKQLSHQVRPSNQWPLFDIQVTCFSIGNEFYKRLHIGLDLLVLDLWSIKLIMSEWNQLYFMSNAPLNTINLSFQDYVLTQRQFKNTTTYKMDKKYWLDRLNSFPSGPNLPLQCLPNELHIQRHCNSSLTLDKSIWQKLKQRISNHKWTSVNFLISIYAIVLSKWSENKHFAFNLPIFNQSSTHSQVNDLAGNFTTTLLLEINLTEPINFNQFIETIQKQLRNDLEHISYSGVSFIRDLMKARQTRKIILPIAFTYGIGTPDTNKNNNPENYCLDQLPVYSIVQIPQVFLNHIVFEKDEHLLTNWNYVENLFPSEMISNIHHTFIDVLQQLALCDDMWYKPLLISLPIKQQERRANFNKTQWKSNTKEQLLHLLVMKQAQQTPEAWAVQTTSQSLTYKQLVDRAYSLAYYLQQQHEMECNQIIGVLMKKGWEQIVACLSILISGNAYLPLDIDSSDDRLSSLIQQTNVKTILTQSDCHHQFQNLTTISVTTFSNIDYPKPFPLKQQLETDLAYVIYTSSSKCHPKGVMISHQAVLNTIIDMNSRLEISPNDSVLALSHLNVDSSIYDIFGMLIKGGTVVVPDHEHYNNPQHWYDMMIKYEVTIWNTIPMLIQMLIEFLKQNYSQTQLRHILLSGDLISLSLIKSIRKTFGEQLTITSLAGATEASIWSIAYTLPEKIPQKWKSIPCGTPLRNQQYHVYDINLNECPEWVTGELYIGGVSLAHGYWNDQEHTDLNFIIHPRTGERLYRTGDYGRFISDGYIEFIGRKDSQVNIHGHRIELGEIEYYLQQHSDIHQAVVTQDQNSRQLVGYIQLQTNSHHHNEFDQLEISMFDPIERTNFKLARHGVKRQYVDETSFVLTRPELTEKLISSYYQRKTYRQFMNDIVEKSDIEHLLTKCYSNKKNTEHISEDSFSFDTLNYLLSLLTPINVLNQPLPKYRYASYENLYPVQTYIEICTFSQNISPGLYYHNPVQHTLQLIDAFVDCKNINTRLHLIGRSAAIAPLCGKTLASQFCELETGYIIGLLKKEAGRLGFIITRTNHHEIPMSIFNLDENDTHYCFEFSSVKEHVCDSYYPRCIIYQKFAQNNADQWFTYDEKNEAITPLDTEVATVKEDIPLSFETDNYTKAIFRNCQTVIFFIGRSKDRLSTGIMSHSLMSDGLEMNIGMCPIGVSTSLPINLRTTLDIVQAPDFLNRQDKLLHTLFIGKITNEQKYDRAISTARSMSDYNFLLKTYLNNKLPNYMIPSYFRHVETFPLNSNGQVDRESLAKTSRTSLQKENTCLPPSTELEKVIANIWNQILSKDQLYNDLTSNECNQLPLITSQALSSDLIQLNTSTFFHQSNSDSFFDVGGDSLLLLHLYQQYQALFNFDPDILPIRSFFECDTIAEHGKLLQAVIPHSIQTIRWQALNITQGKGLMLREEVHKNVG